MSGEKPQTKTDNQATADPLRYFDAAGGKFCKLLRWNSPDDGGKKPFEKDWQNNPYGREGISEHVRAGGNVGLVLGVLSANLGLLDADENFSGFCERFPMLAQAPAIIRAGADKGKVLIRVIGTMPPAKKFKRSLTDKHPFFEFLSTGNQGVIPPSIHPSGEPYELIRADCAIPKLTPEQLSNICQAWTGTGLDLHQVEDVPPQPLTQQPKTGRNGDDRLKERVLEYWDVVKVFQHFNLANEIVQENAKEIRLKGNGGLLVREDGVWSIPGMGEGWGGGPFEAWVYCRSNGANCEVKPDNFYELLCEMATAAGIEIPKRTHRGKTKRQKEAAARILAEQYIAVLRELSYEFRMLELDYTVEVNGEILNDAIEAEIRSRLRDRGYDKVNVARDAYIAYAYQHRYHPIKDYLEAQKWDGRDHIGALCEYFGDRDHVFPTWLRKWLIGAVARVYLNGVFNRVLILAGEQDLGKSYFVRWLCSGIGGKYFTDSGIDPDNKDHSIRLMNAWIWEVNELNATTGKADRNALKSFLSREQIRERVPYGRNDIIRPALTSFIATANPDSGFLNDPTGNRRFAACELLVIVWDYAIKVDVNQVWAQAKYLYDQGEEWRYTGEEKELVKAINDRYEIENPVHSWLERIIEQDPEGFTPTTDILDELRARGMRGSDKSLTGDIASYMRRLGIEKTQKRMEDDKRLRGWSGIRLLALPVGKRDLNHEN